MDDSTADGKSRVVVAGGLGGIAPVCITLLGKQEPTLAVMVIALVHRVATGLAGSRRS